MKNSCPFCGSQEKRGYPKENKEKYAFCIQPCLGEYPVFCSKCFTKGIRKGE